MPVTQISDDLWTVGDGPVTPPPGSDVRTFLLGQAFQAGGGVAPVTVDVRELTAFVRLVIQVDGSVTSDVNGEVSRALLGWLRPPGAIEGAAVQPPAAKEGQGRMTDAVSARAVFGGGDRAASYLEDTAVPVSRPAPDPAPVVAADAVEVRPSAVTAPQSTSRLSVEVLSTAGGADAPPARARAGFLGVLAQLGLPVKAGLAERRRTEAAALMARYEAVIRQTTWTRPVSVLVADMKGGSGKTTCTVGVASAIASIRGGGVAVLEVSDDPGSLTFRTEGSPRRGVGELVRDLATITNRGQLSGYTAPQTSFASVIGSVGHRPPLSRDDVLGLAAVLDGHFEIRVMDSGNQPSSSAFLGAIDCADVLVVPLLNAADVAAAAIHMLDAMRARGGKARLLAENAIVVRLTDGHREVPEIRDQITALLEQAGVTDVFEIPFDEHLAERGPITWSLLAPSTRAAFTATAAGVVCALQAADTL